VTIDYRGNYSCTTVCQTQVGVQYALPVQDSLAVLAADVRSLACGSTGAHGPHVSEHTSVDITVDELVTVALNSCKLT
jgi:hypothetical protein